MASGRVLVDRLLLVLLLMKSGVPGRCLGHFYEQGEGETGKHFEPAVEGLVSKTVRLTVIPFCHRTDIPVECRGKAALVKSLHG